MTENEDGKINTENKSKLLDVNEVYGRYIDLYIHLDNLRWTFTIGIIIAYVGIFSSIKSFEGLPFTLILGIIFIILALIMYIYTRTIGIFIGGQDYICLVLAELEEESKHIFSKKILYPKTGKDYMSFYSRRKQFILNDSNKFKNPDIFEERQHRTLQNISKITSITLFIIGIIFIISNIDYLLGEFFGIISQLRNH